MTRAGAARTSLAEAVVVQTPAPAAHASGEEDDEEEEDADGPHGAGVSGRPDVAFVSLVGGMYTVRGRLRLDVPADAVYGLLTDYGSSHRVFDNIAGSTTVYAADGSLQLVQASGAGGGGGGRGPRGAPLAKCPGRQHCDTTRRKA